MTILVGHDMRCCPFKALTPSAFLKVIHTPQRASERTPQSLPPPGPATCPVPKDQSLFSATKTFQSMPVSRNLSDHQFCSHCLSVPVEQPSHSMNGNMHRMRKSTELQMSLPCILPLRRLPANRPVNEAVLNDSQEAWKESSSCRGALSLGHRYTCISRASHGPCFYRLRAQSLTSLNNTTTALSSYSVRKEKTPRR